MNEEAHKCHEFYLYGETENFFLVYCSECRKKYRLLKAKESERKEGRAV